MTSLSAAAAVIFNPDGELLIAKRRMGDTLGGYWEFPGGKCEAGESLEECLRREVLEETSLQIKVVKKLENYISRKSEKATLDLWFFYCRLISGEARALESSEVTWVAPQQLKEYRFPPANQPIIYEIIDQHRFLASH